MTAREFRLRDDGTRMIGQMIALGVEMNGNEDNPGPRAPWKMWSDAETGDVVLRQWDPE